MVSSITSAIGCPSLVHPTFRQGPVIVSLAVGLAIGGPNVLKLLDLVLKVFQVTDDKRLTNKVSLIFHSLLLPCDFVEDLSEDSFQESKSFDLEFEIAVVSVPVSNKFLLKEN